MKCSLEIAEETLQMMTEIGKHSSKKMIKKILVRLQLRDQTLQTQTNTFDHKPRITNCQKKGRGRSNSKNNRSTRALSVTSQADGWGQQEKNEHRLPK